MLRVSIYMVSKMGVRNVRRPPSSSTDTYAQVKHKFSHYSVKESWRKRKRWGCLVARYPLLLIFT